MSWKNTKIEKVREYRRKWQAANPEKVREYSRRWHEANARKGRGDNLAYGRAWYAAHREQILERREKQGGSSGPAHAGIKKWKWDNPDKFKAQNILWSAIRNGRIIRPSFCQECGKTCVPDGHHADYSLPLFVEWLCKRCHGKRRTIEGNQSRAVEINQGGIES
jgi:hypothetical protein